MSLLLADSYEAFEGNASMKYFTVPFMGLALQCNKCVNPQANVIKSERFISAISSYNCIYITVTTGLLGILNVIQILSKLDFIQTSAQIWKIFECH